jgi:hypothetical protein
MGLIQPVIDKINELQGVLDTLTGRTTSKTTGGLGGAATGGTGSGKKVQYFAEGGIVAGSGPQLAIVHGGEKIIAAGGGTGTTINVNISRGAYIDGPSVELLTRKIASRLRLQGIT